MYPADSRRSIPRGRDGTIAEGRAGAGILLAPHPDLTALICLSDQLAIGAIGAAGDLGRIIPDDLSIIGFDGTHVPGADGLTLTTIRQPHEEKGRLAARLLLAALRGDALDPVTLPHELIVGNSVAPVDVQPGSG